jgi:predicted transcriptional regulator
MATKERISRHILIDGELAARLDELAEIEHRPTLSNAANAALRKFFEARDAKKARKSGAAATPAADGAAGRRGK